MAVIYRYERISDLYNGNQNNYTKQDEVQSNSQRRVLWNISECF